MSHFTLIARDIPVQPLLGQVDANPQLWGSRGQRLTATSPHRETKDIWLRYMNPSLVGKHDITTPHVSEWYPEALALHGVLPIVHRLKDVIGVPLELGGILMTRIPPGKQVHEHHDRGGWHAHYYDLKAWTVLRANEACVNYVEDEPMIWRVGESWHHDNLINHRVENLGDTERIVLITCFRRL